MRNATVQVHITQQVQIHMSLHEVVAYNGFGKSFLAKIDRMLGIDMEYGIERVRNISPLVYIS